MKYMIEIKTQYYKSAEAKPATLFVLDAQLKPRIIKLKGHMTIGADYPGNDVDIRIMSDITSGRHGEFIYEDSDDSYYYIDNNSLNGTYINGKKLSPYNKRGSMAFRLSDGDILRIDRSNLNNPHRQSVLMVFSRSIELEDKWDVCTINKNSNITIGRDENCTICLDDLMASRRHALISFDNAGPVLYDTDSQNGIYVNGKLVQGNCILYNHDVIRIANTTLIIIGDRILYNHTGLKGEKSGTLVVNIKKKTVDYGRRTLIKDIRFEAETGDFILILGGSGAGKTTLVKSILGDGKSDSEVILDGLNLYDNFKAMKSQIGLVPQFIELRLSDKVKQTLMDIAQIKLVGKDYTNKDRIKRVDDVMDMVGITNLQNHLISQLSGGQKKKVSVAAQLVGFQKVFICDEPDSGLDAASRTQQMEILSGIAENGKIVMVISHEPDDAVNRNTGGILFTKVLVIAKSDIDNAGHLAFFGSPSDALAFFSVNRLQDIMSKINPPHEGGLGYADRYIKKYQIWKDRNKIE